MKLTVAAFLPHLQPTISLNQRDKFFYFHPTKVSHFPRNCLKFELRGAPTMKREQRADRDETMSLTRRVPLE